MEEAPSQLGDAPSPRTSPGEELRAGFASFDAASFLASQQNERERKGKIPEFQFMYIYINRMENRIECF